MPNITTFDPNPAYIYLPITVASIDGKRHKFDAIFDTGSPRTEFSDRALHYAGFLDSVQEFPIQNGLQTQKHRRMSFPEITICGHPISNLEVFVSHFEETWGIDALIGLDFLRLFRLEIDFSKGVLVTAPLSHE